MLHRPVEITVISGRSVVQVPSTKNPALGGALLYVLTVLIQAFFPRRVIPIPARPQPSANNRRNDILLTTTIE